MKKRKKKSWAVKVIPKPFAIFCAKENETLQQYERGHGDYTQERHEWLDNLSVADIVEQIEKKRKALR